jgi:ATP-dependent Zn protease
MEDETALTPYTNGSRAIVEGATLIPLLATPGAASHLISWTRTQALKSGHEASHACVAALLEPPYGPIATYTVSIKGQWSGATTLVAGEDSDPIFSTASALRGKMITLMAGLEGERALFSEPTDGSTSDIDAAADTAAAIISAGLHPESTLVTWHPFGYNHQPPRWLVEERYQLVEKELQWARGEARRIVEAHRDQILGFARILFEKRRMESEAVDAALTAVGIPLVERKP